jgi:hypothetical protein
MSNKGGTITHVCYLLVTRGHIKERVSFYITNLGKDHFIFGYPWCQDFKPDIDWENLQLKGPSIKVETLLHGKYQHIKEYLSSIQNEDFTAIRAVCPPWSGVTPAEMQGGQVEINCTNTAIEMAHKYAKQNLKEQVILSEEFKQHAVLFLDKDIKTFPPA